MKNVIQIASFLVISLLTVKSFAGSDIVSLTQELSLNEYQCLTKGRYINEEKNYNEEYLFPMNVFAKSIDEAYQIALNKLEVRRINNNGAYISVTVKGTGAGSASVAELECKQLPKQSRINQQKASAANR